MAGRVAVTGATGGIGRAVTEAFAAAGYEVLAVGRSSPQLEELSRRVAHVVPAVLDLAGPVSLPTELAGVGRLDGLVHCAGVAEVASVEHASAELWAQTMAVNMTGPAALTQALLPALRAAAGRVVFINAGSGLSNVPRWSAYAASKAALREFADSLRAEEDAAGIRVTSIYPGGVRTELLRRVREQFGRPYDPAATLSPQSLAAVVVGVFALPSDVHLTEICLRPAPTGARPARTGP